MPVTEEQRSDAQQIVAEATEPVLFDLNDVMVKTISQAVPSVTLWGDGDPYLETHGSEQLSARKTIILPNIGHWVPINAANELAEQVRALR